MKNHRDPQKSVDAIQSLENSYPQKTEQLKETARDFLPFRELFGVEFSAKFLL